jgi:hypothetical protein
MISQTGIECQQDRLGDGDSYTRIWDVSVIVCLCAERGPTGSGNAAQTSQRRRARRGAVSQSVLFCLRKAHYLTMNCTPDPQLLATLEHRGCRDISPTLQDWILEEALPGGAERMLDRSKLLHIGRLNLIKKRNFTIILRAPESDVRARCSWRVVDAQRLCGCPPRPDARDRCWCNGRRRFALCCGCQGRQRHMPCGNHDTANSTTPQQRALAMLA